MITTPPLCKMLRRSSWAATVAELNMGGRYHTGGGDRLASSPVELRVLGSSGAAEPHRRSTAFLVGGRLAVDGGAIASGIPLAAQRRVRTVLLTHRHFDHLRELPLFLDNVYAAGGPPVAIGAERVTLDALFRHVFNGQLWPDVRRFERPPAVFFTVRPGERFRREGLEIVPFRLPHTAPTVGYLFRRGRTASAILGDTGYEEEVFARLAGTPGLDLVVIEASYPSRLGQLADTARHLTPALLARGLLVVRRSHPRVRVLATHLKPPWAARIERELERLSPRVSIARDGARLPFLKT